MVFGNFKRIWAHPPPQASFAKLASATKAKKLRCTTLSRVASAQGGELQQSLNPLRSILLLFFFAFSIGSAYSQDLEETIYSSLESFVANPSEEKLQLLQEKENQYSVEAASRDEQLALLSLQCNLGYYNNSFGKTQEAIQQYESAWKTYKTHQLNNYDISEFCLKPLGNLYTKTGAFSNAENTIKQYIFYAEENKDLEQKISGIINLSVVYNNTGNQKTAIAMLREALQTSRLSAKHKTALENNLATNLFAIGNYQEAQQIIDNAIAKGRNISANVYKNAAQLALQKRDFPKVERYFNLAEKALLRSPSFSARALAKLYEEKSQLYILQKKNNEAQTALNSALQTLLPNLKAEEIPTEINLYPENTFPAVFDGLAQLQTNSQDALDYYDLSFYVADLQTAQLNSQEAKILHQLDNRKRSEKCIALLYQEFKNTNETEYLIRAFYYAERSKAVVLSEMQSQQSLIAANPNDSLLLKEQRLSRKQEAVINELVRAQLTQSESKQINSITEALNNLNLELKNVKSQILEKYPTRKSTTIQIEELQSKLKEDNASMAYFFFGKAALYHFSISDKEIQLTEKTLGENFGNTLSTFINFFENSSAINNDISKFTETSARLYEELEISNKTNYKDLVVVPDGLLNFVPFEALLTQETSALQFSEMPFLIKTKRIAYHTTASFYSNTKTQATKTKLLGVFPVFEGTKKELRYSLNEAEDIENELPSTILLREEATKTNFLSKAANYNILHLSTHASGGDFVIPANIEFADDVMLLYELYSLDLTPKLVVLSACETGVGKLQKGEGAMSIARGFQYAGAQNLLFSLWKVNDLSTSQIMGSFYKNFSKTESAFAANHLSKIEYLEHSDINNVKKSPYYWSSFVYYGELSEEKTSIGWFALLIGALILLLVVWLIKKRVTRP